MAAIDNIREYLNERGMTITDLAEKSGLAFATLSRILNGKQELKPNSLSKIADALEVSVADLDEYQAKKTDTRAISGYLEYKGEITKITSLSQLEKWVESVKLTSTILPKQVAEIRKINKENRKRILKSRPNASYDFNIKEFRRVESYDATQLDITAFKTGKDHKDGVLIDFGNQCSGYPFMFHGVLSHTSENAYLAGQFSTDDPICAKIQKEIMDEENGFSAKKYIRNKYNEYIRKDWAEMNAEWMMYVIWMKCKGNEDFAKKLISLPADAIITENSTTIHEDTSVYWGTKNPELEDARDKVALYAETEYDQLKAKGKKPNMSKAEYVQQERDAIQYIGTYSGGMNFMGKILKRCQIALLNGTEPEIDFELLRSKNMYFMGNKIAF